MLRESKANKVSKIVKSVREKKVKDPSTTVPFKVELRENQKQIIQRLKDNEITVLIGNAGTSKDFMQLFRAVDGLIRKEFEKIIICKPIVEIGKTIGFLPGPQPLDSNILTPTGWKKIRDLFIGDEVITPDGKISKIINKSIINKEPVYEIVTTDNRKMKCATNHLFHTMTFNDKKHRLDKKKFVKDYNGSVKSLTEIINTFKTSNDKINHYIPYPKPCEFISTTKKIIPPYTMGVLLGDGHMKGVNFTNIDHELVNKVKSEISNDLIEVTYNGGICYNLKSNAVNNKPGKNIIIYSINKNQTTTYKNVNSFFSETNSTLLPNTLKGRCKRNSTIEGISYSYGLKEAESTNIYKNEIIRLGLIDKLAIDKFIPKEYIYNSSVEERIELLRGLLDTDGTNDKKAAAYTTISKQLKDDIIELVRSLGGKATYYTRNRIGKTTLYNGKNIISNYISYEIVINLDINPFFISRKASKYNPSYKHLIGIKEINKIENDYVQCIEIDSKEGLYITDNYVVTHNSELDKIAPYAKSFYDNLAKIVGKDRVAHIKPKIEFEAVNFLRGNTFDENSVIILSEAQNLTLHELMSFITRLPESSKLFINGDLDQSDIKDSGLNDFLEILKDDEEIEIIELGDSFQMRRKLITRLTKKYNEYRRNKFSRSTRINI